MVVDTAEQLAPIIGLVNLAGFVVAAWFLTKARGTALGAGAWILAVGMGLHVVNDYLPLVLGYREPDDAYDHLFIHIVVLATLVAFGIGLLREPRET